MSYVYFCILLINCTSNRHCFLSYNCLLMFHVFLCLLCHISIVVLLLNPLQKWMNEIILCIILNPLHQPRYMVRMLFSDYYCTVPHKKTIYRVNVNDIFFHVFVLCRYTKMKTATNIYIFNLALADALATSTLPFQSAKYLMNTWPFGEPLCKLVIAIDYYNMFTSIFTLTMMSVDRYIAVCHPVRALEFRTPVKAKFINVCVWILSSAIGVPIMVMAVTKVTDQGEWQCAFSKKSRTTCYITYAQCTKPSINTDVVLKIFLNRKNSLHSEVSWSWLVLGHSNKNLCLHLRLCGASPRHYNLLRADDPSLAQCSASLRFQGEGQEHASHHSHGVSGGGGFYHLLDTHSHLHHYQNPGGDWSEESLCHRQLAPVHRPWLHQQQSQPHSLRLPGWEFQAVLQGVLPIVPYQNGTEQHFQSQEHQPGTSISLCPVPGRKDSGMTRPGADPIRIPFTISTRPAVWGHPDFHHWILELNIL